MNFTASNAEEAELLAALYNGNIGGVAAIGDGQYPLPGYVLVSKEQPLALRVVVAGRELTTIRGSFGSMIASGQTGTGPVKSQVLIEDLLAEMEIPLWMLSASLKALPRVTPGRTLESRAFQVKLAQLDFGLADREFEKRAESGTELEFQPSSTILVGQILGGFGAGNSFADRWLFDSDPVGATVRGIEGVSKPASTLWEVRNLPSEKVKQAEVIAPGHPPCKVSAAKRSIREYKGLQWIYVFCDFQGKESGGPSK